jgi:hypothetical protein
MLTASSALHISSRATHRALPLAATSSRAVASRASAAAPLRLLHARGCAPRSLVRPRIPTPLLAPLSREMSAKAATPLIAELAARVQYVTPVPSDIDISQALKPIPIARIAEDAGILDEELEPYGK